MSQNAETKKLYWHSRRGMLELDILLEPFVTEAYPTLSKEDQARYEKLLTCEDQDLYSWFMGRSKPADPDIARLIDLVLEHARPPSR